MDVAAQVAALGRAELTPLVRKVLGRASAEVESWQVADFGWHQIAASTGGLFVVGGEALDNGVRVPWQMLLKVLVPSDAAPGQFWYNRDPGGPKYWKREALFFQSDLPEQLGSGVSAPRCYGVQERQGEREATWIWMEYVAEPAGTVWTTGRLGLAARHLGRWQARLIAEGMVNDRPWFSHQPLDPWLKLAEAHTEKSLQGAWQHPLLQKHMPAGADARIRRLLAHARRMEQGIARQEQTICHLDADRRNMLHRATGETCMIDWALVGLGAVGQELGTLIGGTLFWLKIDSAEAGALVSAATEGMLEGLHEGGWRGQAGRVLYAGFAHAALQWALVIPAVWLPRFTQEDQHEPLKRRFGAEPEETLAHWGRSLETVLGLGEQALEGLPEVE